VDSTLDAIRRRKELVAFAIGVTMVVAGFAALARSHQRTSSQPLEDMRPQSADVGTAARLSTTPAVGPALGASPAAYVDRRRAALGKLAASQPGSTSWAVVSFDSYREPEAVVSLLSTPPGRTLTVYAFQQRVPAPGFAPEAVELGQQRLETVIAAKTGAAVARRLARQRTDLQRLVPTVENAAYRQVYQAEARRLTGAVDALQSRPATLFALLVRGTNDALARLAKLPGVRLVDVAGTPSRPDPAGFYGLLPDDTKTTTFGSPAP
jgi:hypothetical protein